MMTIAIKEPGIFFVSLGLSVMIRILMIPITNAQGLTVSNAPKYAIHLEMKSAGTLSIVNPNKSFICVVKIVIAIPLVKPTTIG